MKPLFDYLQKFPFKNLFAVIVFIGLLRLLGEQPTMHDVVVVLLTLVIKYYFDTSASSSKKDETIGKALDAAQQLPGNPALSSPVVNTADTVTVTN